MKRIYVAGPYSASNAMDVLRNIRYGIEVSTKVLLAGFAPFCPWLDYHFVLEDNYEKLLVSDLREYSLAWLEVSDAMLVLWGWEKSEGTLKEIERAKELDIPIYYELPALIKNESQS